MTKVEDRFWTWINRHWTVVILLASTLIAFLVRFYMRGFHSRDMQEFLILWYEEIKSQGGLSSLVNPVGDYNIPYQTVIALFTCLPFKPIYLYKLFSCLFDWLLASLIGLTVYRASDDKFRAAVAYGCTLNMPIVVFNSSLWGQCDSVYSFFCLLALYLLWRRKNTWAFIALGAAFAFKLQAVFVLPFFLFLYVKRRDFSFLQFLWIPAMMIILSLGGILQGFSIPEVFGIYQHQVATSTKMNMGYPGFWHFMIQAEDFDYYLNLFRYGILLTVFVLMLIMIRLFRNRAEWSIQSFFKVAFLMTYTAVIFQPSMHERYGYLYLILALLLCFMDRKMIPVFLVLLALDLSSYSAFLFPLNPELPWRELSLLNCACYAWSCYYVLRHFEEPPKLRNPGHSPAC